jgi:hypothetical protein
MVQHLLLVAMLKENINNNNKTVPLIMTHMGGAAGLVQLVRFLVMELTHTCSNSRFNMCVIFMTNYSFSGSRRPNR